MYICKYFIIYIYANSTNTLRHCDMNIMEALAISNTPTYVERNKFSVEKAIPD